jgi:hypothetical protein
LELKNIFQNLLLKFEVLEDLGTAKKFYFFCRPENTVFDNPKYEIFGGI